MDDDEDDYVLFGTPLPEIEDETILRKKAAKELQVRDENGRQRFHGAFTGGFSAGYFNTVGTKEGWAPSAFTSSRSKISERIQQNPEDFMDDEDFGEFGIATRKIHTTTNFQDESSANSHKRRYVDTDSVIPGEAPLKDIIQPVRESIGILILRKLGWREGQGIGPRIKKYSAGTKVYGCSLFPDTVSQEEDDPIAAAFTFAPDDIKGISYKPKDNYFGLGYTGLSKQSVLTASSDTFAPSTTKSWLAKDKRKLKIAGQAFGVGAFEDEDEDIYFKDDMSQYDFSDLAPKQSKDFKAIESVEPENSQGVLEGFLLASLPPLVKKHYPPPTLPSNFKPVYMKSISNIYQNVNPTKSRHTLSASDRSDLLGERKFQKISSNVHSVIDEKHKSNPKQVNSLPSTSTASLNFRPFPNDLSKQKRYEEYIMLKEKEDVRKLEQPSSMTEWEKQQELEEFAKASVLFKPLSNVLSSRFESRSHLSVEHEVMSELEKLKKEKEEKQVVAKKNLIGTKNRKTFEWHPISLLCKRMNVPNPFPNSNSTGTQNIKERSVFDHLAFNSEKSESSVRSNSSMLPATSSFETETEESSKNLPDNVQKKTLDTSMSKNEKILPAIDKKPPMDFFKDIFDNSSSEDEASNEETKEPINSEREIPASQVVESNTAKDMTIKKSSDNAFESNLSQKKDLSISNMQNKKVGFGVFANLDLDALNQKKPAEKPLDITKSEDDAEPKSNLINNFVGKETETDVYGPELPPNYLNASATVPSPRSVPKKQAKSKSSHKHKNHKHKHKKKKKKSSKRDFSSSELSEDELEDISPLLIIEKMKKLQRKS